MSETTQFPIKAWAEEDRPREKLLLKGIHSLSNAELIAVLIGSGNREESAVDLSKKILHAYNNRLDQLGKQSIDDLCTFKGIGTAKAISIAAALELGRRRQGSPKEEKTQITCSRDAFLIFYPLLTDLTHEEFWVLLLNKANYVSKKIKISSGGIDGTIADIKIIFKKALHDLSSSIILCHNHPSGNLKPSKADVSLTKKIKESGSLLDIQVLDHIIVAGESYFSFADEGMMN